MSPAKKILVVVTSCEKYPEIARPTGIWLGEVVHFVDQLRKIGGFEIDYVSPKGGYTPIDPHSFTDAADIDWKYYHDREFMNKLGQTLKPENIKDPKQYTAIYYVGGHGVIWDFPENKDLARIAAEIYENGGYVTSVCHGALGLLNIKLANGENLIKGKTITGFSNEEEKAVGLDKLVPYLTETELISKGASYVKAESPFAEYSVVDGHLITGQNPASGGAVGKNLIKELSK
ncbi:ThiJ/PfpI domain-containing protein [Nadsonia fulvescens var. elongata DSM 6958]|uniref:D-lactate dehydratase n=1 Tax=Nadsonia fulvescens var. elongata DSM 6958 TaxID=857566 RepID=A0A1E3PRV6_9ASCO|nr:ThiJ/PfpI domain-containing protein [Nadsonia fulvescens var. elongata DSM 6958]